MEPKAAALLTPETRQLIGKLHSVLAAVTDKMDSAKAFDFAHRMRDPLIREDALRLLAAKSIQQKSWEPIWKLMNDTTSLTHTDRAAILLGFLEAIAAAG